MKKLLIIAAIVVAIVAMTGTVAMAGQGSSGYNTVVGATVSIHGSYADTGNECEVCHAVHGATGTYKLLRNNSAASACNACHVGASALTAAKVYTFTSGVLAEHVIGASSVPDNGNGTSVSSLACMDCHDAAPHGAGANASGKLSTAAYTGSEQAFCAGCHEANNAGTDTHVFDSSADNVRAFAASGDCNDCHNDTAGFPHETQTLRFRAGTTSTDGVDAICLDCHDNGTSGVGRTY